MGLALLTCLSHCKNSFDLVLIAKLVYQALNLLALEYDIYVDIYVEMANTTKPLLYTQSNGGNCGWKEKYGSCVLVWQVEQFSHEGTNNTYV